MNTRLRSYYQLTKPGIIYGNALNATAGFLLASAGAKSFDPWLFITTILGMSFVIASACVYNNYIDRAIDIKMTRTSARALVTGAISGRKALIFATTLCLLGFAILVRYTNFKVVLLGIIALCMYVVVYGLAKRRSVHGTIIGSIAGSLPPVAGYIAVTNNVDAGAAILFLILTFWQMSHFFAIAIYRHRDYAAASIPVWPVKKGIHSTKIQIAAYITGFIVANAALTVWGYTGYAYMIIMTSVGLMWMWHSLQGFTATDDVKWARKLFFFSLIVILIQCFMVSVGALLP